MRTSLTLATDGLLKRGVKTTLTMGTMGHLRYPTQIIIPTPGYGGGSVYNQPEQTDYKRKKIQQTNNKILVEILKFWSKELY
jgi:hypothetical protein